jgi:hypothetical protein
MVTVYFKSISLRMLPVNKQDKRLWTLYEAEVLTLNHGVRHNGILPEKGGGAKHHTTTFSVNKLAELLDVIEYVTW